MIIGLNKILGTQTINLETGEIIDNSVIDCFGGGGGGKGGGGSTKVIYQESPQSIAYREAQLKREKEREASENKIKADASAVKADSDSSSPDNNTLFFFSNSSTTSMNSFLISYSRLLFPICL